MAIQNPHGCCGVEVDCCDDPMPDVLHAMIEDKSNCACADGKTVALAFTSPGVWRGETDVCGTTWRLSFMCGGENGSLSQLVGDTPFPGCSIAPQYCDSGATCDPVHIVFSGMSPDPACDCEGPAPRTVDVTITE